MLINMTVEELKSEYAKSTPLSIMLSNNITVIGSTVEHDSYLHIMNPMRLDITINEEGQIIPFLSNFNIASGERFVKIYKQHVVCCNRISENIKTLYNQYLYNELVKILNPNSNTFNDDIKGLTKQ